MPRRWILFLYALACYGLAMCTLVYAMGFVAGVAVPRSIDAPAADDLGMALAIDAGLLLVFAVQHSVMARASFKGWLARRLPAAAERSTYVLASALALAAIFALWRPLGGSLWRVADPVVARGLVALGAAGWLLALVSTFMIDHFELFGVRQAWNRLRERAEVPSAFRTPGPYRLVRHPLYAGFLIAFWSTPAMTIAHALFAAGMTAYVLVAIRLEERDLIAQFGDAYRRYRLRVPMLLPSPRRLK
jgi:methanethiol S-methyltransferase